MCEDCTVFLGLNYWSIYYLTLGTTSLSVQPCSFILGFASVVYAALPAVVSFCLGNCVCFCVKTGIEKVFHLWCRMSFPTSNALSLSFLDW